MGGPRPETREPARVGGSRHSNIARTGGAQLKPSDPFLITRRVGDQYQYVDESGTWHNTLRLAAAFETTDAAHAFAEQHRIDGSRNGSPFRPYQIVPAQDRHWSPVGRSPQMFRLPEGDGAPRPLELVPVVRERRP